jgi:hypothetical protein
VPRSNELRSALLAAGIRGRTTNPITELLGCYAAGDRGAPGVFDRCENEHVLREGLRIFGLSRNSHIGAGAPQSFAPLLCLFPGSLELAPVGVGEGRGAGETELYEVLVEEALVAPVCVGVQV